MDVRGKGRTGPTAGSDGTSRVIRLGKTGEQNVSDAHARYFEAVSRGTCYSSINQSAGALGTTLTGTAVTLTLYNPIGSRVLLAILAASASITAVPGGAGAATVGYAANTDVLAGAPTITTDETIRNCLLGGPTGTGKAYSAATLPATPVLVRMMPGGVYWATAAGAAAPMSVVDYVDGALILQPNTAVTLQGLQTAHTGRVGIMWEEVPIIG